VRNVIGIMQGRLSPPVDGKIQFFPKTNWRSEFPILKDIGIHNLEWTFDKSDLFSNPIITTSKLNEVLSLSSEYEVLVRTATCDNLMNSPIHKVGPEGMTDDRELENFINLLGKSPISTIVWPLVDAGSLSSKSEIKSFLKKLEKHFSNLQLNNIRVAFETDLQPKQNRYLMDELPREIFGINLDIGNSASYGNSIIDEWALYGDRIMNIHLKDRVLNGSTVPLGKGAVIWEDVTQLISNFNGLLIMQCARISERSEVETIKEYLEFLKDKKVI
jgi:L-ribulose-5-phosphate 3-epimerase